MCVSPRGSVREMHQDLHQESLFCRVTVDDIRCTCLTEPIIVSVFRERTVGEVDAAMVDFCTDLNVPVPMFLPAPFKLHLGSQQDPGRDISLAHLHAGYAQRLFKPGESKGSHAGVEEDDAEDPDHTHGDGSREDDEDDDDDDDDRHVNVAPKRKRRTRARK